MEERQKVSLKWGTREKRHNGKVVVKEQKISGKTQKKAKLHILNDLCEQSKGVKIEATTKSNEPNNK